MFEMLNDDGSDTFYLVTETVKVVFSMSHGTSDEGEQIQCLVI